MNRTRIPSNFTAIGESQMGCECFSLHRPKTTVRNIFRFNICNSTCILCHLHTNIARCNNQKLPPESGIASMGAPPALAREAAVGVAHRTLVVALEGVEVLVVARLLRVPLVIHFLNGGGSSNSVRPVPLVGGTRRPTRRRVGSTSKGDPTTRVAIALSIGGVNSTKMTTIRPGAHSAHAVGCPTNATSL